MNYSVYKILLNMILEEEDNFKILLNADNTLGLNVTYDEVINYLEFASDEASLSGPIIGSVIITEGDILSILKIINELKKYEGEYILYINGDNLGTITFLVNTVNYIYENLGIKVRIKIDYNNNYNEYVDNLVTIIGSESFILETEIDFTNAFC